MKIGHLHLNKGRGSGVLLKEVAKRQAELGHDVTIISSQKYGDEVHPSLSGICKSVAIETDVIPVNEYLPGIDNQERVYEMGASDREELYQKFLRLTEEVCDDRDILHVNHANILCGVGSEMKERYGIPYVITAHGTSLEKWNKFPSSLKEIVEQGMHSSSKVIVTTNFMRRMVLDVFPSLSPEKIEIIPPGVDTDEFRPDYEDPPDGKMVLFVGALMEEKGVRDLLEASEIYNHRAKTVIVGDGPLLDELEVGGFDNVEFKGHVPYEELLRLYREATLVSNPPIKDEHFGIVNIEALASGTPVIGYQSGGVPEIIDESVGMLVQKGDIEALGKAILYHLEDDGLPRKSSAARERAVERYSYDSIVRRINEVYKEIVG